MKKTTFVVLILFFANFVLAQKNILIIPFDVKMYNNQESEKICKYSDISYDKSVEKIRTDLDFHIYAALKDSLNVSSLLRTYTTDASSDLEVVHANSQYFVSEHNESEYINKSKKSSSRETYLIAGEVVSATTAEQKDLLVNVKLQDPQLYTDLIQSYQAQYVVYLTQFELLGDFSNPYSVADNSYQRTIRVHYVIYNAMGKFVDGDVASMTFSAKVNDIDQICDQYLPVIAKKIARKIP